MKHKISAIAQCRTHFSGMLAPLLNKTTRLRGFASVPKAPRLSAAVEQIVAVTL